MSATYGALGGRHLEQCSVPGDNAFIDGIDRAVFLFGQVVHDVQHHFFENSAKSTCADTLGECLVGDEVQRFVGELQVAVLHLEQSLVLLDQSILRLGHHAYQTVFLQWLKVADHRQTSDQLGDQPELQDVFGLHLGQQFAIGLLIARTFTGKAQRLVPKSLANDVFDPDERATHDEQDVTRVHLDVLLFGMLASTLRRNVGDGSFEHLQQTLLNAFTRDIACDRNIGTCLANLVDLVDVQDSALGRVDIEVGRVQQFQQKILDVFADVTCFGERCRITDGKGYVQHSRQRSSQQRLSAAGRSGQQNVALLDLHLGSAFPFTGQAFVVIVNSHREHTLRRVLSDHVLVQVFNDLPWRRDFVEQRFTRTSPTLFLVENRLAKLNTLSTDVDVTGAFN